MKALTHAEQLQVNAAEGWLMLGNPVAAHEELEQIDGDSSFHPEVISVRWEVYAAAGWWEAALVVAKALCEFAPESSAAWICQANSLRNSRGLTEACALLRNQAHAFPQDAIIRYNLACYTAQMGYMEESCGWLVQAFELEENTELKLVALYDPDLQPLWDRIGRDRLFHVTGQMLPLAQAH